MNEYKQKQRAGILFPQKIRVARPVNADLSPILVSITRGAISLAPAVQHIAVAATLVHIKYLDFVNQAVVRRVTYVTRDRNLVLASIPNGEGQKRNKYPKE
jgi:hypothetical protein